jgi:hypothetical protein
MVAYAAYQNHRKKIIARLEITSDLLMSVAALKQR